MHWRTYHPLFLICFIRKCNIKTIVTLISYSTCEIMLRSWILINGNSVLFGNKKSSYIVHTYIQILLFPIHTSYKYIMILKSIMNNIDIIFMNSSISKHSCNMYCNTNEWNDVLLTLYHCCFIPSHPNPCNASRLKWWSKGLTVASQIVCCVEFVNRKKERQREHIM